MKSIDENEVVTKGLSGEKHILNKHSYCIFRPKAYFCYSEVSVTLCGLLKRSMATVYMSRACWMSCYVSPYSKKK